MEFLKNLQSQPPHIRKAVFWLIVVVLATAMGFWWFQSIRERLSGFKSKGFMENVQLPEIEIPDIDIPGKDASELEERVNEETIQ